MGHLQPLQLQNLTFHGDHRSHGADTVRERVSAVKADTAAAQPTGVSLHPAQNARRIAGAAAQPGNPHLKTGSRAGKTLALGGIQRVVRFVRAGQVGHEQLQRNAIERLDRHVEGKSQSVHARVEVNGCGSATPRRFQASSWPE